MFDYFNKFYSWIDENPEKVDPYLIAVYFALLNRANKSLWKEKFAIILVDIQEMTGINSRTTMIKTLNKLEEFGFIETVSKTQNQYKNRVICLPLNGKHMKSTRKPNENQLESSWTQNKDLLNDKDLLNNKEGKGEKKTNPTAWWTYATKEVFNQKVNEFAEQYPAAFLEHFSNYYTQESALGRLHINHENKFSLESKLREWWSDPKTKAKYTATSTSVTKRNRPLL